jgi:hypothetical protein
MRHLLGQSVCGVLLPQGLIGITPQPEGDGPDAPATHARVMPIDDG